MWEEGMPLEKTLTPGQKARRKYEAVHKEERQAATGQFSTRLPREIFTEINQFLNEHHISKVQLIYAGYEALRSVVEQRQKGDEHGVHI